MCCPVLYCINFCIILYCIAYSACESKSPAVSKNRNTCKACLIGFLWEMEALGDGLLRARDYFFSLLAQWLVTGLIH